MCVCVHLLCKELFALICFVFCCSSRTSLCCLGKVLNSTVNSIGVADYFISVVRVVAVMVSVLLYFYCQLFSFNFFLVLSSFLDNCSKRN